jgi:hypothetical protein
MWRALVTNKEDFLNWLQSETDFLHISSHGKYENGVTTLHLTQGGKVTAKDIWNESDEDKSLNIKARVVLVNACETSYKDLREAFFKAGRRRLRYYIAPRVEVPFDEAFFVALLFYKKAFLDSCAREKRDRIGRSLRYTYNLKDVKTNYLMYKNPWL